MKKFLVDTLIKAGLVVEGSIATSELTVSSANIGNINLGLIQKINANPNDGKFRFLNGSGGGWSFEWYNNGATAMTLSTNNNLLVGTDVDSGYKVDVVGEIRASSRIVTGLGGIVNNSLTTHITNHFGSSGFITFGFSNVINPLLTDSIFDIYQGNPASPSYPLFNFKHALADSTGGSSALSIISLTTAINQSAGSNGVVRGIYYNPSITNINGSHFAFESTSGKIKVSDLSGVGTRMVVVDSNGVLSTQSISAGNVLSVFGRTGAVTAQSGDYTTAQITESGNLYFTTARARASLSLTTTGTSGAATYDSNTGVLNIPQYQSVLTNPVTGTGSAGQVAFWSSSSAITGESNLYWDSVNDRLGINQPTPTNILHITSGGSIVGGTQITLEGHVNGYGAGFNASSRTSAGGTLVQMGKVVFDGEGLWNTTVSTQDAYYSVWVAKDGSLNQRQKIDSDGVVSFPAYTTNGFVKFSGSTGTLSIDTNTYALTTGGDTANAYILLYNALTGDLNTYGTAGLISAEYTGTSANRPTTANGHFIQISDTGVDVATQWYYVSDGADIYMRLKWGAAWRNWRRMITDANIASQSVSSAATLTTARNFTINGSAKSFNGSADVSWTASEIGLTNYLPLSGGTLTGPLNGTSATFTSNYLLNNGTASKKGYTYQSPASNWGPQVSGLYFTPNNAVDAATTFTIDLWDGVGSIITPLTISPAGQIIGTYNFASSATNDSAPAVGTSTAENKKYNYIGQGGYWGIKTIGTSKAFAIDTYNSNAPKNVLTITQTGSATFADRVMINGAPYDADISLVVKALSGAGKYIMFGRDSSDTAVFSIASNGAITTSSSITVFGTPALQPSGFGYDPNGYKTLILGPTNTTGYRTLCMGVDVSGNPSGAFSGAGGEIVWRNTQTWITPNAANNGYNTLLSWNSSGQFTFNQAITLSSSVTIGGMLGFSGDPDTYIYFPSTYQGVGSITIQPGFGSAAAGGGLSVFGHSHATKPGWVVAGISAGSAGKFAVNTYGTANGTNVFTVDASANVQIGSYAETNTSLTFAANNNGVSKINFYDQNNTEGLYMRTDGESYGGTMTFGARWDDDEAKVVFKMYQVSAGATYNARVGIGTVDPAGELTVKRSYNSGFTPIYFGNTSFTAWNRQSYDTFILQQDDVTSFRMVEKNGETTANDQVLTFSIGDGIGRIATSGQPLQFYVNGSPSGLAYQGLSGTQVLAMNTNGNAQFNYQLGVTGVLTCSSSISATFISLTNTQTLEFTGGGNTATYTRTAIYSAQNNTSNNNANGIFIERGRLSDSLSAEIRRFIIGARGGNVQWICDKDGATTQYGSATATAFFESSDSRIKTLLDNNVDYSLVSNVEARFYEKNGVKELGYFAQDFEQILPSAIHEDENGLLNLSYTQVHTAKIAALEARVKELEEQLKNK